MLMVALLGIGKFLSGWSFTINSVSSLVGTVLLHVIFHFLLGRFPLLNHLNLSPRVGALSLAVGRENRLIRHRGLIPQAFEVTLGLFALLWALVFHSKKMLCQVRKADYPTTLGFYLSSGT